MNTFKLPLLFIFALILTGCAEKRSVLLDDNPCTGSCWREIRVGETSTEEALRLISGMEDIDQETVASGREYQSPTEVIAAYFDDRYEQYVRLTFPESVLNSITFATEKEIPLRKFVEKYGDPQKVDLSTGHIEYGNLPIFLYLYYPEIGICISHVHERRTSVYPEVYKVEGSTRIKKVVMVDPALEKNQLGSGCFPKSPITPKELQDWKGYGDYPIYYDSNRFPE